MRVAVLGGGPGGLFMCHNMEKNRQKWVAEGRDLKDFPEVVCFEKSMAPGGVWRAKAPASEDDGLSKASGSESSTCMYDNLWTNGPSHAWEFYDYTFDEHFGAPVSVYFPRKDVLEYILARVTKNCPSFLEKYIRLGQEVLHVKFDEKSEKFCVEVKDVETGVVQRQSFDRCIWAGGHNGHQSVPASLASLANGFDGRVFHSSETGTLEQDVKGKRVLMIGGSYSSEDLALQALKLGATKIYISSRQAACVVTWTSKWPENKVELLLKRQVLAFKGKSVTLSPTSWTWPSGYELDNSDTSPGPLELHDIDTVIFCTGYKSNMAMLDNDLKSFLSSDEVYNDESRLYPPADWKMADNDMDAVVEDDISVGKCYYMRSLVSPTLWNGFLMKNPKMMFLDPYANEAPLLGVDILTWQLSAFLTGEHETPSPEEMSRQNYEKAVRLLDLPFVRYCVDSKYADAVDGCTTEGEFWEEIDPTGQKVTYDSILQEYYMETYMSLAELMHKGNYPIQFGNEDALNGHGRHMIKMDDKDYVHRTGQGKSKNLGPTFRDYDDGGEFHSLHTGTKAVSLAKPWLDL